jgi:hypothetical protein
MAVKWVAFLNHFMAETGAARVIRSLCRSEWQCFCTPTRTVKGAGQEELGQGRVHSGRQRLNPDPEGTPNSMNPVTTPLVIIGDANGFCRHRIVWSHP